MKKKFALVFLTAALVLLALCGAPAMAEAEDELDEWTVLFYICGSDLESRYSYATGNLEEIAETYYPENLFIVGIEGRGIIPDEDMKRNAGNVNVLIETGGSKEWHAQDLGMDVDPTALQRWSFNTYSQAEEYDDQDLVYGFELLETLPLQSMADPETLSDFIRWGVATKPAKKYALVLWDHGDGARSGLFIDELFDKDVMYLYELKQALEDGGVHFEDIIIDACLMANIETVWNVKDYADWLVASEETVPGQGTGIGDWLQQLRTYPECDGEWLGRLVCDTTNMKYANEASDEAKSILTWSVIDLSKIDALIDIAGRFFKEMGDALRDDPSMAGQMYVHYLSQAAKYGDGQQHMREFGSLVYNTSLAEFGPRYLRNAAIQALSDAVVYCVRGPGRSEARGLTFCYAAGLSDAELDIYAHNFPMPHYLAFIDAISDWTAPDWVYEYTDRLPKIDDIEEYRIVFQKQICADGMPGLQFQPASTEMYVDTACYNLYQLNKETGELLRLGQTDCIMEPASTGNFSLIWRAADPVHWPSVDGQLMCMDLLQTEYGMKLYNVPVQINSQTALMRLGRRVNYAEDEAERVNEYEVYGMWEGYEENSTLFNRSVKPLSSFVGQEYKLLYPVDSADGSPTRYESSARLTMYRALDVQEIPLPAGTYYLEYEITDIFMRTTALDRIEIQWDGQHITFPDIETWESGESVDLTELRQNRG